jgi:hypothetical protein
METLTMNAAQYLQKIKLGYFEPIKCLSVSEKLVNIINVKNEKQQAIIKLNF